MSVFMGNRVAPDDVTLFAYLQVEAVDDLGRFEQISLFHEDIHAHFARRDMFHIRESIFGRQAECREDMSRDRLVDFHFRDFRVYLEIFWIFRILGLLQIFRHVGIVPIRPCDGIRRWNRLLPSLVSKFTRDPGSSMESLDGSKDRPETRLSASIWDRAAVKATRVKLVGLRKPRR